MHPLTLIELLWACTPTLAFPILDVLSAKITILTMVGSYNHPALISALSFLLGAFVLNANGLTSLPSGRPIFKRQSSGDTDFNWTAVTII